MPALLCNDSRGSQQGSCQRQETTRADSYLIPKKLRDVSHGKAGACVPGCWDQLVSQLVTKKTFWSDCSLDLNHLFSQVASLRNIRMYEEIGRLCTAKCCIQTRQVEKKWRGQSDPTYPSPDKMPRDSDRWLCEAPVQLVFHVNLLCFNTFHSHHVLGLENPLVRKSVDRDINNLWQERKADLVSDSCLFLIIIVY